MIIDEEEDFDDGEYDDPTPTVICPECGSDDIRSIGEDDNGDDVWICEDCGEEFSEGEEE